MTTNNEKNKKKKQINSQGSSSSDVSARTERLSTNRSPFRMTRGDTFNPQPTMMTSGERRNCYECREQGHVASNCPYVMRSKHSFTDTVTRPQQKTTRSITPMRAQMSKPSLNHNNKNHFRNEQMEAVNEHAQVRVSNQSESRFYKRSINSRDGKWKQRGMVEDNGPIMTSSQGKWVEMYVMDEEGRPKASKAWVLN